MRVFWAQANNTSQNSSYCYMQSQLTQLRCSYRVFSSYCQPTRTLYDTKDSYVKPFGEYPANTPQAIQSCSMQMCCERCATASVHRRTQEPLVRSFTESQLTCTSLMPSGGSRLHPTSFTAVNQHCGLPFASGCCQLDFLSNYSSHLGLLQNLQWAKRVVHKPFEQPQNLSLERRVGQIEIAQLPQRITCHFWMHARKSRPTRSWRLEADSWQWRACRRLQTDFFQVKHEDKGEEYPAHLKASSPSGYACERWRVRPDWRTNYLTWKATLQKRSDN